MTWAKLALPSLGGNGRRQACRPRWIPHSSSCLKAAALTWLAALSDESASKQEVVIPTICRQVCFIMRGGSVEPLNAGNVPWKALQQTFGGRDPMQYV